MIHYRLLEYLPADRAGLMLDYTEELDRTGARPTTNILTLLTVDGPATTSQDITLPSGLTVLAPVLVVACAELTPSETPTSSHAYHRLLIIPGTNHMWHLSRIIPSPDATGQVEAVRLTQLDQAALTALLCINHLGERITKSFMDTTQVA